jgi:dihydropteroate synthase
MRPRLLLKEPAGRALRTPFYIRPLGRLSSAAGDGGVICVGGRSEASFAAAEIVERNGGSVRRRRATAAELSAPSHAGLEPVLQRISAPRSAIAGIDLTRTRVMGIVNVTPDSFSDGGRHFDTGAAIAHALQLEAEGADILDIGGESTRPGAQPVDAEEECRRVLPVIEAVVSQARVPVSIDTRKAEVMRRAADAGARVINDVSALMHDPDSLVAARETKLPVILMHAQGDPRTMQNDPRYDDVVLDVYDWLEARVAACEQAGMPRERLIVDPGIGFGKTLAHNLSLLASLSIFHGIGCAVLLGASRKTFIGKLLGVPPAERLPGSLAAALIGADQGVQIVRVHDVAATRQALAVWAGAATAG